MNHEIRIAPPNSLVLVMDPSADDIPEHFKGALVATTDSCIAVGTLSADDGISTIMLCCSDSPTIQSEELTCVCDCVIDTPQKKVVVNSIYDEALLGVDISTEHARIRIWVNHLTEPDLISIVVSTPTL